MFVANYGGGSLSRLELNEHGTPKSQELVPFFSDGPRKDRQEQSHAHGVFLLTFEEETFLFCSDFGTDRLRTFRLLADGRIERLEDVLVEAGSGPRHLAFHSWEGITKAYIVDELSNHISVYLVSPSPARSRPIFTLHQSLPVLPPSLAPHIGDWTAAEVSFTPSSQYLIVSTRSPNPGLDGPSDRLVIFDVDTAGTLSVGKSGLQEVDVKGRGLRHCEVLPSNIGGNGWVAVACEKTEEVVIFELDSKQGLKMTESARISNISAPTVIRWRS